MKRIVAIAAVTALVVALVLAWRPDLVGFGASSPSAPSPSAASAAAKADAAPAASATSALPAVEVASAHDLDYRFEMTAPFTGGADQTLRMRVRGTLELGTPRPDGDGAWLPARLRAPTLELDEVAQRVLDLPATAPEQAFALTFAARVLADGRVDAVRFDPKATFAARSMLATVAYAMQRSGDGQGPWQVDEHDLNGSYTARYQRGRDGSLDKAWTIGQGDDPPARLARISAVQVRYTLAGASLQALDYREAGRASTHSLNPATFKPYSLQLALHRRGDIDAAWASDVQPAALAAFSPADAPSREVEVSTRSYDAIVDEAKARAGQLDAAGHVKLRDEWTHLLARDAEALARTETALRQGTLAGEAQRMAVEAIVGARTPQAQDKVGGMIGDGALAEPLRLDLLAAVALMTRPTPALINTLERVAYAPQPGGIGGAAATTLGASAALLAEQDPEAARAVVGRLVANARPLLHPPTKAPKAPVGLREAWLAGLGNTGDPQALPEILAALDDEAEIVRGQAAISLRRYPAASCLDAMVTHMATERSAYVRENLVDAARSIGPAKMLAFVEKALRFDESVHVRLAAAYAVAAWSTQAPGLRKVLASALEHESSPKVAEALQSYLERGNLQGQPEQAPVKLGHPTEAP